MKNSRIGTRSRSAFAWDLIGSFIKQGTTIVITIILARLLGPEEFGLIGLALVFISLCHVFVDVGFTDGLIQRKEESTTVYSSIFYLNLGISILLVFVIWFAAPAIGNFYERDELPELIRSLVLIVPLSAVGKVHEAQLRKQLKFKSLTVRMIISANAGGVAGVVAAYYGMGVYSLVIQQFTGTILSSTLLWLGTGWRPRLVFSWSEVRSLFSFSGYVFLDHGLRQLFQRIDVLFIGKVFSPTILGFYSRAESLNFQITTYTGSTLRRVMFPVLSAVQDDEGKFRSLYLKVFSLLAVLSGGIAGVLFFLAEEIILVLLGSKWAPTIILFQILVFRTVISPFGVLMGKALLSKGYSKEKFFMSLLQRLVMLTPMVVGYFTDIRTFAIAVVAAAFVSFSCNLYLVHRMLKISFLYQMSLFVKPLVPLMATILLMGSVQVTISSLIKAAVFLIVLFAFLTATRDEGFRNLLKEVSHLYNVLRVKVAQRPLR